MKNEDPSRDLDSDLAALLASFDVEVAAGTDAVAQGGADVDEHPELAARLQDAKECLLLLEKLWPRNRPNWFDAPRSIGRFRIIAEIGRGGFGVVYLAHDEKLGRQVALKVQRPEAVLSSLLRRRFMREAQAAARLQHSSIATVYEVGEAGPRAWIASEYCVSGSLAGWLKSNIAGAPPRAAALFVASLADAIEYAHQAGVLHRDLKPSNVLLHPISAIQVTPADNLAEYQPKLIDFGLVKLEGVANETQGHVVVGTPAYMSPEQARAQHDLVGPPTDVYGLGTILYELLTGTCVVDGGNYADTLRKIVAEEPAAPRSIRAEIPQDLEAICLKCLEKLPKNRYPSAAALVADLGRFLQGRPTLARPASALERFLKWVRRRPTLASAAAIGLLVTLAVIVGSLWAASRLKTERDFAERLRDLAESRTTEVERLLYPLRLQSVVPALTSWNGEEALRVLDAAVPSAEKRQPDFVWRYLASQARLRTIKTFQAHEGRGYAIRYCPNGSYLASAGADGVVRIWNAENQKLISELKGHADEINALAFSPDGAWLASVSDDRTVRIWQTADWTLAKTLAEHEVRIGDVAFSPDGRYLASGGADGQVVVTKSATWETVCKLDGIRGDICLSFTPWADELLVGGRDAPAKRWNTTTWEFLGFMDGEMRQISHSHIRHLRVFFRDFPFCIYCWNDVEGRHLQPWGRSQRLFDSLAFSPDDGLLAIASDDGIVRLQDVARGNELAAIRLESNHARQLDFSPTAEKLTVIGDSGKIHVLDLRGLLPAKRIVGLPQTVRKVSYSPDGKMLAACSDDKKLRTWNTETWDLRQSAALERGPLVGLSFSADGSQLAVAGGAGTEVQRFKSESLEELRPANVLPDWEGSVEFSPDGKWLAGIGSRGHLMLSRTEPSEPILELDRSSDSGHSQVNCIADGAGNLMVSWRLERPGGVSVIQARRFDPHGTPLGSTTDVSVNGGRQADPAIALHAGEYLVVWNDNSRIVGRWYKLSLEALGEPFAISSSDQCGQPILATGSLNNFVVAWHRQSDPATSQGVRARFFDHAGRSSSAEVEIAAAGKAIVNELAAVVDKSGRALIAWLGTGRDDLRGPIVAREYDLGGKPRGDAFELWSDDARSLRIAEQPSGNLLVLRERGDASREILARLYSPRLKQLDPLILIGTCSTPGSAHISLLPGGPLVTWSEQSVEEGATDVLARQIRSDGSDALDAFYLGHRSHSTDPSFAVARQHDGSLMAIWSSLTEGSESRIEAQIVNDPAKCFRCFDTYFGIATFSRSGELLAGVDKDHSVCIWKLASSQLRTKLPGTGIKVVSAAFSPDEKQLATGYANGEVVLWNLRTSQREHSWVSHSGSVNSLVFSPNGQLLVTGGEDSIVKIWSVPDGSLLINLAHHTGPVLSAAFSPHGHQLVTAGAGRGACGEILVWNADSPPGKQQAYAEFFPGPIEEREFPTEVWAQVQSAARAGRSDVSFKSLLTQMNSWARERGFAAAIPSFRELGCDGVLMTDLVLLKKDAVEGILMPRSVVDPDGSEQQIIRAVANWAKSQQHVAALVDYGDAANPAAQWKVNVIRPDFVTIRQIPRAELSNLRDADLRRQCAALNRWAQRHGYLGAWPTLSDDASSCGVMLIKPDAGVRSYYPLAN